jgi:hypothetical protein
VVYLSKVEDFFEVSGRGCVIVPAVPHSEADFRLHVLDPIQLRSSGGRVLDTYVAGIEILCGPQVVDRIAFLLPADVVKKDVPSGAEIWLIREE